MGVFGAVLEEKIEEIAGTIPEKDYKYDIKRLTGRVEHLEEKIDILANEKFFEVEINGERGSQLNEDGKPTVWQYLQYGQSSKRFTKKRAKSIASEFGGVVIDMRTGEELSE